MSTLRFRAWDGKQMVDGTKLVFWNGCCYLNESGTLNDPEHPHKPARLKGYSVIAVMQSTGLRDKNGIELYEGDIITKDGTVNAEIRFIAPSFKVVLRVPVQQNALAGYGFADGGVKVEEHKAELDGDCRMVGNIYRNPELLP